MLQDFTIGKEPELFIEHRSKGEFGDSICGLTLEWNMETVKAVKEKAKGREFHLVIRNNSIPNKHTRSAMPLSIEEAKTLRDTLIGMINEFEGTTIKE